MTQIGLQPELAAAATTLRTHQAGAITRAELGQTVRLDFNVSARNVPVTDAEVKFTPPAGADVIGTPVP